MNTEEKVLEKYGRNINEDVKKRKLDPVIGRDEEIRSITRILSRKTKNNPVLIGEPGVGKTAIAEGLAARIVRGDVPEGLKDNAYWFIYKDDTMNMYFAGNTTGTFGTATSSGGILTFTGCTAGKLNGWKSTDGQTWTQVSANVSHYATVKTNNASMGFDFGFVANDVVTWFETSGNFDITYGS